MSQTHPPWFFTVPGGFVDPGCLRYLTSAANQYLFGDVPYTTCDIFFYALLSGLQPRIDGREATEALFVRPGELDMALLAFRSTRLAAEKLQSRLSALP